MLVSNLAFGGSLDLSFARMVMRSTMNAGAVLARIPVLLAAKASPLRAGEARRVRQPASSST
jgi:hypothetical protein